MATTAKKPSLKAAPKGSVLSKSVSKITEDGPFKDTWLAACPGVKDSICGKPADGVFFQSPGWPTREIAEERLRLHFAEHKDPTATTPSLEEFRATHGLRASEDGARAELIPLEDLP